jgi:hypothetical protein
VDSDVRVLQNKGLPIYSSTTSQGHKIIDVDLLEFEETLQERNISAGTCEGYVLILSDGKSVCSCYSFALHDTCMLPWSFKMQNRVMTLFSQSCSGWAEARASSCHACQCLIENKILEGILM